MLGARSRAAALLIALLASCSLNSSSGGPPPASGAWPLFRADLARDGHAGTLNTSQSSHLALAWRTKLAGAVDGSAVVAGGDVVVGSEGGDVADLSAATGAVLWKRSGLGAVAGSPAIDGSTVYVGTLSGQLVALSRTSGAIEWAWRASGVQPAIWATPTVYGGAVIVGIASQAGDQPLEVGRIVAVRDGREAWQLCVRDGCAPGGGVWSTPAIDSSGHAFVGLGNPEDGVLAFNAATGGRIWKTSFYADNGRDLDIGATPCIYMVGGREVVGVGSVGGVFRVLDAVTGGVVWSVDLVQGSAVHGLIASPAYDGKLLYVASAGDRTGLFALDANSGVTRWSHSTSLPVYAAPAVADRVVLFGEGNVFGDSGAGMVFALRTDTGQPLWTFDAHAAVRSGPIVAGDQVVVGDASGAVSAFRPRS